MIRTVIKLGIVLVIGVLVYNFFLGTEAEKASSRRVFNEVKEVGVAIGDLLKSEKDKFDEGKYDDALSKIEDAFGNLREKARELDDNAILDRLAKLEDKRQQLEEEYRRQTDGVPSEFNEKGEKIHEISPRDKRKMKRELDELLHDTEEVVNELEQKAQQPY